MGNIFDGYDYEREYDCSEFTKANHFNKLMYLIINVNNIQNGKKILAEYIINNKNEINEKNSEGWTSLLIAARNSKKFGILEEIKLLIENGADIDATDINGRTPLMMASSSKTDSDLETVKLLIECGADINAKDNYLYTPLLMALRYNTDTKFETIKAR